MNSGTNTKNVLKTRSETAEQCVCRTYSIRTHFLVSDRDFNRGNWALVALKGDKFNGDRKIL